LVWVFFIRFSDLLFVGSTDTTPSWIFTLCTLIALFLFLLLKIGRRQINDERLIPYSICAALCSVFVTVIPMLPQIAQPADSSLTFVLSRDFLAGMAGLFAGLSFGAASAIALTLLKRHTVVSVIKMVAAAFTVATAIVYLINLWLPSTLTYLVAVLPLLSLALITTAKHYRILKSETQVVLLKTAKKSPRFLPALLFSSSFLAVYMIAMFPKTTQLAPSFYTNVINGMSVYSILMLALCSLLFLLGALLLSKHRRYAFVAVLVILGLFAAIFYSLPSMSTSAIPFVLITPFAIMLTLVALALLVFVAADSMTILRSGFMAVGIGAILAGCFGSVFMGPLYGKTDFQDRLFDLIPAVLLIALVTLLLLLRNECLMLFFPEVEYPNDLDTSTMKNRCTMVTQTYGLTARESEVLELLSVGRNEPFVANALMVSKATIKTHIAHIYQKTGVSNRQELIDLLYD
jgi:DNA-binding CsgD family transcriptional regulator/MFS family permease